MPATCKKPRCHDAPSMGRRIYCLRRHVLTLSAVVIYGNVTDPAVWDHLLNRADVLPLRGVGVLFSPNYSRRNAMKNHMHDFPIEYLEEIRDTVRGELLKPHLLTVKQQAENHRTCGGHG